MTYQEYLLAITRVYEGLNFPVTCQVSLLETLDKFEVRVLHGTSRSAFAIFAIGLTNDKKKIYTEYSFSGFGGNNVVSGSFERADDLLKIQHNIISLARTAKSLISLVNLEQ